MMSLENFKNRKIEWDAVNKNFDQSVQIVSGDVNSRTVTIVITDNGEPINLTGYSVKLVYKYIYNDSSGFVMLTPTDAPNGEFSLTIPTEMTSPGSIKSNLILLNENLEQVIVSKSIKFISDDSTVTDLAQEVNSKIDDFTKLLLESMPQVMRSELNDLHAQSESNTSNIELKANSSDMTSLQSAMNNLQSKVEAFGITPDNLITIKSLLDAIANNATDSEVAELINSVNVLTNNISLMSGGDYSPKANQTDLESLQSVVNNQTATISTKANQTDLDNLQTDIQTKVNAIELASGWQFTNNTLVIGWDATSLAIIQQESQEAMTLKINVSELRNRVFEFKVQPAISTGQFLVLADAQNKKIYNADKSKYDSLVTGTRTEPFCEINEDIVRLYFDDFTAFYPNTEFIYITLSNQNITDFYFKEIHADKPMSNLIIEYINGCASRWYDLQTKQPVYLPVNWMHYIKIKNTGMGRIKFPSKKLNTVNIQLLYLLDSDGNVVKNVPYAKTLTPGSSEYHAEKDGYVTIFLDKIPTIYPTFLLGVPASVEMSTDWYTVEGAFTIAERFPEINNYNKKVWAMLDDVAYNIVDGQTGYIYPDSFVFNSDLENANNLWTSGMVGRKAKITPSSTNVRWTHNNSLVRDVRINKIPSSAGEGGTFNVMLIGESTTESFDFLKSLKEVCDTDLATFNFVGKKTSGGINYEAYAGWGIGTLWHAQTANNKTNNFWNPANQHFDLDYYFTQNPTIPVPDIVSISYGINDVNRYVTSSKTMVEHYENIIAQFKAKNPSIKILIGLTHAYSLHENFRGIKTRDYIMDRVNKLIAQFKNRESDGIYLNPMFYNLDCVYGMQYEEIQAHPFNPTKTIMNGTDTVHPSIYGYKQTAQMTYWSLKNAINQM